MKSYKGALRSPNWDLWANMPTVELWQAVALSMLLEPESVQWDRHGWMAGSSDVLAIDDAATFPDASSAKLYRDRYRLLQACYWHAPFTNPIGVSPPRRSPVKLAEFCRWASTQPLFEPLPDRLSAIASAAVSVDRQSNIGHVAVYDADTDAERFRRARGYPTARPRTPELPNWEKWRLIPRVPLWKAVCLSFDLEPREDIHANILRTRHRFDPRSPNLQDRLEILQANLSLDGPIRPQGALYSEMLQNPFCEVSLSEVAAFLTVNAIQVPAELAALAGTPEPCLDREQETKEQREDRRLKMCECAGLTMDKFALLRMPDGISKVAEAEGVTRQAFTEDVKSALKRKLERQREGSRSR